MQNFRNSSLFMGMKKKAHRQMINAMIKHDENIAVEMAAVLKQIKEKAANEKRKP